MSSKKERRRLYEGFGVLDNSLATTINESIIRSDKPDESIDSSIDNQVKNANSSIDSIYNNYRNEENGTNGDSDKTSLIIDSIYNKQLINIDQTIDEKKSINIERIIGLQRKALQEIVQHCKQNGTLETRPLGVDFFTERLGKNANSCHNIINQLIEKKVIERVAYQRGAGGWSKYKVSDAIYKEMLLIIDSIYNNYRSYIGQTIEKPSNSSSKDNNYINTTTFQIPEEIKHLISAREVSSLLEKDLLSAEDIQRSLDHFSYDFKNNLVKAKTSPINLLFGLMRSGRPYKSLTLLEEENRELHQYQVQLQKLEDENKRLKEVQLKEKFIQFKKENPDFVESIRKEQKFELSNEILEEISFSKFVEKTDNERTQE